MPVEVDAPLRVTKAYQDKGLSTNRLTPTRKVTQQKHILFSKLFVSRVGTSISHFLRSRLSRLLVGPVRIEQIRSTLDTNSQPHHIPTKRHMSYHNSKSQFNETSSRQPYRRKIHVLNSLRDCRSSNMCCHGFFRLHTNTNVHVKLPTYV
jgi:hypothetical protein